MHESFCCRAQEGGVVCAVFEQHGGGLCLDRQHATAVEHADAVADAALQRPRQ